MGSGNEIDGSLREWRGFDRSSCETGTFMRPSLVGNSISTVCKVPGASLSPGRLKWALVAQRTELRAQSERPASSG